jgi:YVTN family beta-propeller protein
VVDAATASVTNTITLPAGSRPMKVWVSADDREVYLSNGRAGTVSVLDARSLALLRSIKVGARPWGIGFSPDGKYLFTANGPSNDVSVVDLATHEELMRIKAGSSPWGVAIATERR